MLNYTLPNLWNSFLSTIPTLCYFKACLFYDTFIEYTNCKELQYYFNTSSRTMISSSLANIFVVYPLFEYKNNDIDKLTWLNIFYGCLMIDTVEYFWHYIYHKSQLLYSKSHSFHHKPYPVYPWASFYNNDLEVFITSSTLLICFLIFEFSYYEYIIITSLSYVATVCDHTNTSKKKFHIIHHNGNKNTNLQQPFFTFWDHIFGTYNPKTELKIPFVP